MSQDRVRVAFMGGKPLGAACLDLLAQRPDVEVVGVVCRSRDQTGWWTGEGRRVIDVVEEHGLPRVDEADLLEREIDVAFSVLYYRIIRRPLIEHCSHHLINLHPAPLPFYRGSNSYSHAIINGEDRYGVTLHVIDEGIDTGPIVGVRWFPIEDGMTARELHDRSQREALAHFTEFADSLLRRDYQATPQDEVLARDGGTPHTYDKRSLEPLKAVSPDVLGGDPEALHRLVRGLDFPPFEPAHVAVGERRIYLRAKP